MSKIAQVHHEAALVQGDAMHSTPFYLGHGPIGYVVVHDRQ